MIQMLFGVLRSSHSQIRQLKMESYFVVSTKGIPPTQHISIPTPAPAHPAHTHPHRNPRNPAHTDSRLCHGVYLLQWSPILCCSNALCILNCLLHGFQMLLINATQLV